MGIVFALVLIVYLILALIVLWSVKILTKSKKKVIIAAILIFLGPFWRFFACEFLFMFYRITPLQEIHQTVEAPGSVYWQDNVWPGFDEYGRNWMIDQYLDGIHLKALAMNGEDNKIYLYRAEATDFEESRKALEILRQREAELDAFNKKNYAVFKQTGKHIEGSAETINKILEPSRAIAWREHDRIKNAEIKRITDKVEVYESSEKLPLMNYLVAFNPVPQWFFTAKLLHADRISIIDVKKNQEIAFSQRYLAYSTAWLNWFGGRGLEFDNSLGDEQAYEFDDRVLFEYAAVKDSLEVTKDDLNRSFYKRIQ